MASQARIKYTMKNKKESNTTTSGAEKMRKLREARNAKKRAADKKHYENNRERKIENKSAEKQRQNRSASHMDRSRQKQNLEQNKDGNKT